VKKDSDLDEAYKKYNSLLDALSSGVIMIDKQFNMIACNKSGYEILGLTKEDILGKRISGNLMKAIRVDGTSFRQNNFRLW
jgi:PAS domain S-box-containing protein